MIERILGGIVVIFVIFIVGWAYLEATFDWSKCRPTQDYRDRHSPMWIQKVGDSTIIHPARDWTERRYVCPSDEGSCSKWRSEDRPD